MCRSSNYDHLRRLYPLKISDYFAYVAQEMALC